MVTANLLSLNCCSLLCSVCALHADLSGLQITDTRAVSSFLAPRPCCSGESSLCPLGSRWRISLDYTERGGIAESFGVYPLNVTQLRAPQLCSANHPHHPTPWWQCPRVPDPKPPPMLGVIQLSNFVRLLTRMWYLLL